ncbi:MAG: hypothetical protein JXO51_09500 [Candidatus Aminicenantes bacterium]|nr:hypothetical protein [Candidatus Aminicenantes bacterium]
MKKTLIACLTLFLLSAWAWSDPTEENANEAKYYDNAKVVRIKSVEGEGFIQRSYDEGNEEATANLPLFEKDIVGTTDGRLAVYLGRLNYLRLDADTVVVLEKVPQLRQTDLAVRVEQGAIYLDVENLDRERGIEVQTPDCGIFLLDKGVIRVNVVGNGRTEVLVLEGIAEVAGRESSRNVRENQKIVMAGGGIEERPFYFYASDKDDFDLWNEAQNRELGYARYGTARYLKGGYEDYEYEMTRAGRWTYMSDYNSYVWIPYRTGIDWMPYSNGRWVWHPYYGYVWSSYDTCGWFTHHYGRWHWSLGHGWYWIPSYHWSPAWVSWFWNDHYYGWCPLSWWNRPIVIINNRWDRHYNYHRGIPHHSRSTIIIRKNELAAPNIHRVVVSKGALAQDAGQKLAYRGKAPSGRLAINKVTVVNAQGRSVTYKKGAIVSQEKYRSGEGGGSEKGTVYRYNQPKDGTSYRSAKKTGGESGAAAYRSRSSSSGSAKSASSSKSSYRSRSGSGSSSSKSSSSSSSGSKAKKKEKGEPSYLSRSGSGNSAAATQTGAPAPSSRSRYSSGSGGSRFSYRSHGSTTVPRTESSYSSGTATRRILGSIFSSRKSSSASYSASGSRSGSGGYATASRSNSRPSSGSSSYRSSGSASSRSSRSYSSAGSHSSSSSRSYRSSSSSSSSRASSSSSSSGSSSGRSAKKK